jgi:hypothetical protein
MVKDISFGAAIPVGGGIRSGSLSTVLGSLQARKNKLSKKIPVRFILWVYMQN